MAYELIFKGSRRHPTSSNLASASVLLDNNGQGSAWNLRLARRTRAAPRSDGARLRCAFSKSNTTLDWNG